jgi:hypothetical protein
MEEHVLFAQKLKEQARGVLKDIDLIAKLEPHGEVKLTGSFELDLMVWPDIDIQIEIPGKKDKVKAFTDISYELLQNTNIKNVKLINFIPGRKPTMPVGMYMGLTYKKASFPQWKIDIWALSDSCRKESHDYMNLVKNELNSTNRELILDWKHKILNNGRIPQLGSYMLYRAILIEKLSDPQEIFSYLINNQVDLSHLQHMT